MYILAYRNHCCAVVDCSANAGPWPLRVLRSSQLDAHRLDAELQTMLHEQFMAVFQLLPQVCFGATPDRGLEGPVCCLRISSSTTFLNNHYRKQMIASCQLS